MQRTLNFIHVSSLYLHYDTISTKDSLNQNNANISYQKKGIYAHFVYTELNTIILSQFVYVVHKRSFIFHIDSALWDLVYNDGSSINNTNIYY